MLPLSLDPFVVDDVLLVNSAIVDVSIVGDALLMNVAPESLF
jgi:hypothetical protein